MANPTAQVTATEIRSPIMREQSYGTNSAASPAVLPTGILVGRDADGYANMADDTKRLIDIGVFYSGGQIVIDSNGSDGDQTVKTITDVIVPFKISTLSTDAAARLTYGKAVSALYGDEVQLGGGVYGNWVGVIVGHRSVTEVLVHVRQLTQAERIAAMNNSTAAASASIGASSTAELDFSTTFTIPGAELQAGDVLHLRAAGRGVAFTGGGSGTFNLYVGAVAVATVVVATGEAADMFVVDAYCTVRTVGSSGTIIVNAVQIYDAVGTATVNYYVASAAIDTTGQQTIKGAHTFSISNASHSAVLDQLSLEVIRQAN